MSKIVLDVNDNNLTTLLTILKNLKTGMIKSIKVDKNNKKTEEVLEDEFIEKKNISTSKYISPNEFKNRIRKG